MNFGLNEGVAAISALLALASFVLNWAVVRRQTQLQFESLKAQMDAEVLAWVHEAVDEISSGIGLVRGRGTIYAPEAFQRGGLETAQRLSALADRGRLFFPNEAPHAHGQNKEAAFQGFRPPILDAVVFACGLLDRMVNEAAAPDADAEALLVKCRRLLVSEAQNAIDPRRRGQMLRRLATGRMNDKRSAFTIAAELGEAMEARYPGYLERRRDAAWVAEREAHMRGKR